MIPAGFMPGWTDGGTDSGRSWLMICPAGELQALMPAGPHAHHHHAGMTMDAGAHNGHRIGEAHLSCPFAGAAAPVLPTPEVSAAPPACTAFFFSGARPEAFVADFLGRLPSAHGPPRSRSVG